MADSRIRDLSAATFSINDQIAVDNISYTETKKTSLSNFVGKTYVSATDGLGYLQNKIESGENIYINITGGIGNEHIEINASGTTGEVKTDVSDTLGYLEDKISGGSNISVYNAGGELIISMTGGTGLVKVSGTDGLEYLENKIVAGNGINVYTGGGPGDEHIVITNSLSGYTGYVKVSATDGLEYLDQKIQVGTGLSVSTEGGPGDEHLLLQNTIVEINDLSDVDTTGIVSGDYLAYNSGTFVASNPGKVKVSATDGLEYLDQKIQVGTGLSVSTEGGPGDEHLLLQNTIVEINDLSDVDTTGIASGDYLSYNAGTFVASNPGKVKVSATDGLEYLENKIVAGNGIDVSTGGGVGDEELDISVDFYEIGTTPPVDTTKIWFNTTNDKYYIYKDDVWNEIVNSTYNLKWSSENLYNPSRRVVGYYRAHNGGIYVNATYSYSEIIPIKPNTTYVWSNRDYDNSANFCRSYVTWDKYGNKINGAENATSFTSNANQYYIGFSFYESSADYVCFREATGYTSFYFVPYTPTLKQPYYGGELELDIGVSSLYGADVKYESTGTTAVLGRNTIESLITIDNPLSENLNANGYYIQNVPDPVLTGDTVNFNYFNLNSVSALKVESYSYNLFDNDNVLVGYIDDGGGYYYNTGYYYDPHYIPVEYGATYVKSDAATYGFRKTCYYDSNLNVVAGGSYGGTTGFTINNVNVKYVRVTTYAIDRYIQMLVKVGDGDPGVFQSYYKSFEYILNTGTTDITPYSSYNPIDDNSIVLKKDLPTGYTNNNTTINYSTLNFKNSDKVLFGGCSFTEQSWYMRNKGWINKLSYFTDYQLINYGKSGDRIVDIVDRMRNNEHYYNLPSLGPYDIKPKYITIANIGNESVHNNTTIDNTDLYLEELKEAEQVIRSIGAKSIYSTDHRISNDLLSSMLNDFAKNNGTYFHDIGTTGDYILGPDYLDFWGGSHPGSRVGSFTFLQWKQFFDRLPKPEKSIKVFTKRPDYQVSTIDDLNYDDFYQRAIRWKEIQVGTRGITEAYDYLYDRLTEATGYIGAIFYDEYLELFADGYSVDFSGYTLIDATIDKVKPSKIVIDIAYTGLTSGTTEVYLRNVNSNFCDTGKYTSANFELSFSEFDSIVEPAVGDIYTTPNWVDGTSTPIELTYEGKYYDPSVGFLYGFTAASSGTKTYTSGTLTRQTGSGEATISFDRMKLTENSFCFISTSNHPEGSIVNAYGFITIFSGNTLQLTIEGDDVLNYLSYDKIKIILNDVSYSIGNVEIKYYDGEDKVSFDRTYYEPSSYTEILNQDGFDSLTGWTYSGATYEEIPSSYQNYPQIYSKDSNINLNYFIISGNTGNYYEPHYISRDITITEKRGFRKGIVRVICRLFPKIYNPTLTGATTTYATNEPQISPDSYDMGQLCMGLRFNTVNKAILRQPMDIGWNELLYEFVIPPRITDFELSFSRDFYDVIDENNFKNHTFPVQIYDIKLEIEAE